MWLIKRIVKENSTIIGNVLSIRDQVLLVLMKLRLGLLHEDLGHRFSVSKSVVSKIFKNMLPRITQAVKNLIIWPDRQLIRKNLPRCFQKHYRDVICIIDCTEIFIERPKDLTARAQVYSNYKNHSTIKYLIGISPSGAVMFLSCGWGGRVSDKEITLKSEFLSYIEHGDVILADRGFLIEEDLNKAGAHLKMPHFTKGKNQLHAGEVDTSRKLSNVRIHVERVIGSLKRFRIIQHTVPLTLVKSLDNIMITISGIQNLNSSIVK